jgi:hypothetical protein
VRCVRIGGHGTISSDALPICFDGARDFIDVREGIAGTHTVVEENGMPVLLALRLKSCVHTSRSAERRTQAMATFRCSADMPTVGYPRAHRRD